MSSFMIRDADPADGPALSAVYRRASLSNDRDRDHLLAHPDALEWPDLAVAGGRTRAAVADGHVIGFASWLSAGGEGIEIEDMFVDPDWMGHGAGRSLLLDLIAQARRRGVRRVAVTANPDAIGFYQQAGFVIEDMTTTTFGPAPRMYLEVAP
jgi:GNAT superfamily N-acetyltransferase